jgi:hypothetical protein
MPNPEHFPAGSAGMGEIQLPAQPRQIHRNDNSHTWVCVRDKSVDSKFRWK